MLKNFGFVVVHGGGVDVDCLHSSSENCEQVEGVDVLENAVEKESLGAFERLEVGGEIDAGWFFFPDRKVMEGMEKGVVEAVSADGSDCKVRTPAHRILGHRLGVALEGEEVSSGVLRLEANLPIDP